MAAELNEEEGEILRLSAPRERPPVRTGTSGSEQPEPQTGSCQVQEINYRVTTKGDRNRLKTMSQERNDIPVAMVQEVPQHQNLRTCPSEPAHKHLDGPLDLPFFHGGLER